MYKIYMDLETGRVIYIGDGKGRITAVTTDPPKATLVFDHFVSELLDSSFCRILNGTYGGVGGQK